MSEFSDDGEGGLLPYQRRLRRVAELAERLDRDPSTLNELLAMLKDCDSAVIRAAAEAVVLSLRTRGLEAALLAIEDDGEAQDDVQDQLVIMNNGDGVDVRSMAESLARTSTDEWVRTFAAELAPELMSYRSVESAESSAGE